MDKKVEPTNHGKPWSNTFIYESFQDADDKRKQILKEKPDEFQVKVKRRSNGAFVVKTRSLNTSTKTTKKARKKKNKNKVIV